MSYVQPTSILASVQRIAGDHGEFYWVGFPGGEWGAKVIRVDPHGLRWTLDVEATNWVTHRVAAGLLGVTPMTIYRWAQQGVFGRQMQRNGVAVVPLKRVAELAAGRQILPSD